MTALTAVVNYLYGDGESSIRPQEDIARALGLSASEVGRGGGPGNDTVMRWFLKYLELEGLEGDASIALSSGDLWPWNEIGNEAAVRRFKAIARDPALVMVYHSTNHYSLVCGYFESALRPARAFDDSPPVERWVLLADHDPDGEPIRSIRWRAQREQLRKHDRYALIAFGMGSRDARERGQR